MDNGQLHWVAGFIRKTTDDVLRDVYVRGKFACPSEFADYRRRIGGPLLPPKASSNTDGAPSYGEKPRQDGPHKLLARSLFQQCCDGHPGLGQRGRRA